MSDTGIGIPESARARLFEAFEQVDTTLARGFGGTGLGTSIAKRLTEAMGGSIGFESTEHIGSRFWVELPFALAEAEEVDARAPDRQSSADASGGAPPVNVIAFSDPFMRHRLRVRSMRILIADDHAANRMVLERLLQKAGHSVTSVDGAEAVLDVMATEDHDAIVVDLHMPGMSGLDMLREMRTMQAGAPRTPVIVLSADVTPAAIADCRKAGAHAFLAKPVVASKLLDLLSDLSTPGARPPADTEPLFAAPASVRDDVLDTEVLDELATLGLGDDFVTRFLGQCLDDAVACLQGIEDTGTAEQWAAMRDQAHALKGVASNMGLMQLAATSGEVMRVAEWQLRRDWRQRLQTLHEQLARGRAALDARGLSGTARDRGGDP